MRNLSTVIIGILAAANLSSIPTPENEQYNPFSTILDNHAEPYCEPSTPADTADTNCAREYGIDNRYGCIANLQVGEETTLETGYILLFHSITPAAATSPATANFHVHWPLSETDNIEAAVFQVTESENTTYRIMAEVGPTYHLQYTDDRNDCHTNHLQILIEKSGRIALGLNPP